MCYFSTSFAVLTPAPGIHATLNQRKQFEKVKVWQWLFSTIINRSESSSDEIFLALPTLRLQMTPFLSISFSLALAMVTTDL